MKKLLISDVDSFKYELKDENNNIYNCNFEFFDLNVNKGDIIYLSEEILSYPMLYCFGKIRDEKTDEKDIIKLVCSGKGIYLQRYYG
ncbi:MAG: hypothetical protein Q4E75_04300 [bacterium]|nr:hypothetical protein [bacterium]